MLLRRLLLTITRSRGSTGRPRTQFVAVGWNCYPGWLLRDLRHQAASPWDWMQFFNAASLPLLLRPQGIASLAADLRISTIEPAGTPEEPHFWSPRFRVRSPHDHARMPFRSLDASRELIRVKLERRLERLRQQAGDPCCRLVLLCTASPGAYGLEGYDPDGLSADLAGLMAALDCELHPVQPPLLLLCQPGGGDAVEPHPLPGVERAFLLQTRWAFEDAYFELTPGSSPAQARAAWGRTLSALERWLAHQPGLGPLRSSG